MGIYTRLIALALLLCFPLALSAQKKKKKKKKAEVEVAEFTLANYEDSIAYALGMGTARNIMNSDIDSMNLEAYNKGFTAIFMDDSTLIEKEAIQVLLTDYFQMKKEAKIVELIEKS